MKKIIIELVDSFNNISGTGFSGKKLSAFAIITCVLAAHAKWIALGDFSQLIPVITADYFFIATMFGINEYGKKVENDKTKI